MRQRKPMPISSSTRPTQSRQVSTYDKYIALQIGLGKTYREAVKGWKALERLSEQASLQGCILRPISFS